MRGELSAGAKPSASRQLKMFAGQAAERLQRGRSRPAARFRSRSPRPRRPLGALPLQAVVGRVPARALRRAARARRPSGDGLRRSRGRGHVRLPARPRARATCRPVEHDRAETALVRVPCRLWEESSTFELDEPRFERAYRELESIVYEDTAVNTVVAPLLGRAARGRALGAGLRHRARARRPRRRARPKRSGPPAATTRSPTRWSR